MKLKSILNLFLFAFIITGCKNYSTSIMQPDDESFSINLSSYVGTPNSPLIIDDLRASTVHDKDKYSNNALDPLIILPDSTKVKSYTIKSITGASKSELQKESFIFDPESRKIGVKRGSMFGSFWGDNAFDLVTIDIEAQNDKGSYSTFSVVVKVQVKKIRTYFWSWM